MNFDENIFKSLIGGSSPLDIQLSLVKDPEEAFNFLKGYGYDLTNPADETKLWNYHARAVSYIKSYLLDDQENNIPALLADPAKLGTIHNLLIHASNKLETDRNLLNWACAILKVIHVLVHLDNDLFAQFSGSIQEQILKPFKDNIFGDKTRGYTLGTKQANEKINLRSFTTKNFKRSDSSVTKLLANPDKMAFTVLDKVGVRFITKNLLDSFRVMHFLVKNNIIGIFHLIPNQSHNTLYPIKAFMEVVKANPELPPEEIEKLLHEKTGTGINNDNLLVKYNNFSGSDYKFIKFICRKLVHVKINESKKFTFFYPFEVQIMDYNTHIKNLSGTSSHDKYKIRQKNKARERILGFAL